MTTFLAALLAGGFGVVCGFAWAIYGMRSMHVVVRVDTTPPKVAWRVRGETGCAGGGVDRWRIRDGAPQDRSEDVNCRSRAPP